MTRALPRLLWLENTTGGPSEALRRLPGLHVSTAPQYGAVLGDADIVYVPMHADQRELAARDDVARFLERGGRLVVNGHVAHPFLPELAPFVPSPTPGLAGLRLERTADHRLFDGVPLEVLQFTKGVAGFYARGGNPAPAGATVIHTVGPERLPVDWLLALPGGGAIFVHSGNDIVPFLERAGTLGRFFTRILEPC